MQLQEGVAEWAVRRSEELVEELRLRVVAGMPESVLELFFAS